MLRQNLSQRLRKSVLALTVSSAALLYGAVAPASLTPKVLVPNAFAKPSSAEMMVKTSGKADQNTVDTLLNILDNLVDASNQHNLEKVLSFYSSQFHSGDNMNLDAIEQLVSDTWASYPDIRYNSRILAVRVHHNWATVESMDSAEATTRPNVVLNNQPGRLTSTSRGLLYFHKVGKDWKIVSDYTLYEEAQITYALADDYKMSLSAPDQVFSGDTYSATVDVDIPQNTFAIATIAKSPLVFPQLKPEDKFRSLSMDTPHLERVFEANPTNNNEMVTATIGLTEVTHENNHARPHIQLQSIATLVKRVNVVPRAEFDPNNIDQLVNISANGKRDLRGKNAEKATQDEQPLTPSNRSNLSAPSIMPDVPEEEAVEDNLHEQKAPDDDATPNTAPQ